LEVIGLKPRPTKYVFYSVWLLPENEKVPGAGKYYNIKRENGRPVLCP